MNLDISALSDRFTVRRLTKCDVPAMLALTESNPVYYRYRSPAPSAEDMREGLTALPPGKTAADKYYVGFFNGETLAAVLDLVLDYPETGTAFIGLFMLDGAYQRKGVDSSLFSGIADALAHRGYKKLRLAIDRGNPQSEAFWTKNGFIKTGEEYPNGFSAYLPMERPLSAKEKTMSITFRKAAASDIDAVTAIYDAIHTEEETGHDRLEARDLSRARHGGGRARARRSLRCGSGRTRRGGRCPESYTGRCIRRCAVGV